MSKSATIRVVRIFAKVAYEIWSKITQIPDATTALATKACNSIGIQTDDYSQFVEIRLVKLIMRMMANPVKTALLGCTVAGVTAYVRWRIFHNQFLQVMRTKFIDMCSIEVMVDHRAAFRMIEIAETKAQHSVHTHPVAAAIRTNMNHALDDYVQKTGREMYSVSMSAADERRGLRGNRWFFHSKDMAYGFKNDQLEKTDVIKMSDTGYYTDLSDYMRGHEVVLYEISPVRAAAGAANGSYRFDRENRLMEIVQGDAKYSHALWDLNTDHVLVRTWYGTWVYLVEKILHPQYPEYRIIGLFPRRFVWNPAAWLLDIKPLTRRKIVNGNWAVIDSLHNDHNERGVVYTSIARIGDNFDAFVPKEVLTTIVARLNTVKHLELGGIESFIEHEMDDPRYVAWKLTSQSVKAAANVILDYFKDGHPDAYDLLTAPRTDTFTPINELYRPLSDPVVPSMRDVLPPGCKPLIAGAVVPSKSAASEQSAVDGRIVKARNDVKPPGRFLTYAKAFVEEFVPRRKMHTGTAVGLDEVFRRQARPTQRSILEKAQEWWKCQPAINKFFIKREVAGKVNYPRVISTLDATFKTEYSAILYSISDNLLHDTKWYGFGMPPSELVQMLADRAHKAKKVSSTDFTLCDGSISKFLREFIEEPIIMRYFEPRTAEKAKRLHAAQPGMPGRGSFGTKAPPGPYRRSGSPETSGFNSIDCAFVSYCGFREMGLSHEMAYKALGVHCGDDGLAFDADGPVMMKTATLLGMKLKIEDIPRGKPIPFLGRIWVDLWTGQATSFADVVRQVQKLHLTTQQESVSYDTVLRSKAIGYTMTDARTPILGVWATKVMELTANVVTEELAMNKDCCWFARQGAIFEQPDDDRMYSDTMSRWKLDRKAIELAEDHIRKAKTTAELFSDHVFHDPGVPPKIHAMIGGDRVGKKECQAGVSDPSQSTKQPGASKTTGSAPPNKQQGQQKKKPGKTTPGKGVDKQAVPATPPGTPVQRGRVIKTPECLKLVTDALTKLKSSHRK
jgi:hypothetical protein